MPSYSLFIRSEVADFDQWLNPDPSVPEGLFRDAGATYSRLTRDVENPNMITIEGRFPTEGAARKFDELGRGLEGESKNFNAKPGGVYETWIAEAVEGYEFDIIDPESTPGEGDTTPSVSLYFHLEVPDFDEWLSPDPSVPEETFRQGGGTYVRLTRGIKDPNLLTIEGRFPTVDAARAFDEFVGSLPGEMKNFKAAPGGVYETWVGRAVAGYEFDLGD